MTAHLGDAMHDLKLRPDFEKTDWREVRARLPLRVPLYEEKELHRAERLDHAAHRKLNPQQLMEAECRRRYVWPPLALSLALSLFSMFALLNSPH